MMYERMIGNSDECDRLMIKWTALMNYSDSTVASITDPMTRLQTAIMLERVEGMYHSSKELQVEIPKTRRNFPLLSEGERISIINELAVETVATMQGMSQETAKKYLNL